MNFQQPTIHGQPTNTHTHQFPAPTSPISTMDRIMKLNQQLSKHAYPVSSIQDPWPHIHITSQHFQQLALQLKPISSIIPHSKLGLEVMLTLSSLSRNLANGATIYRQPNQERTIISSTIYSDSATLVSSLSRVY